MQKPTEPESRWSAAGQKPLSQQSRVPPSSRSSHRHCGSKSIRAAGRWSPPGCQRTPLRNRSRFAMDCALKTRRRPLMTHSRVDMEMGRSRVASERSRPPVDAIPLASSSRDAGLFWTPADPCMDPGDQRCPSKSSNDLPNCDRASSR
jgi:hypothetical protein